MNSQAEVTQPAVDVKFLSNDRAQDWDKFVMGFKEATFFHLSGWRRILEDVFGYRCLYLFCENSGEIQGVLPLVHFHNFIAGNTLVSTPFLVYGGAVGTDSSVVQALVEKACEMAEEVAVDYLELRNLEPLAGEWETKDLYVTFRKEISSCSETNLAQIPRKQRAVVRKGIKAELDTNWQADVERFYRVFSESYRNLGTPIFHRKLFHKIMDEFGDYCQITTIGKNGRDLSSVLSFVFRNEVIPYYGGGVDEARRWHANDYMYWAVMQRAATSGISVFDYGRSKVGTGSFRFKKHWGFTPLPLNYQYKLIRSRELPDISPNNPKFSLPIAIWKKLPLSVTKSIGPFIAKRVG